MICDRCGEAIKPGQAFETDTGSDGWLRNWHAACNPLTIKIPPGAFVCNYCGNLIRPGDDKITTVDPLAHYHSECRKQQLAAKGNKESIKIPVPQDEATQAQLCGVMLQQGKLHPWMSLAVLEAAIPGDARKKLELAAKLIISAIGEDPDREGLKETPRRFADAWLELAGHTDAKTWTTFKSREADQLVIVKDLRVWSVCEHHLMPFWCDVTIGYLAKGTILGLSKFARIAEKVAHKLQTQERLAQEIADHLCTTRKEVRLSPDIAVMAKGEHTCLAMRGAKKDHTMLNTVLRGSFKADASLREEFYSLARG